MLAKTVVSVATVLIIIGLGVGVVSQYQTYKQKHIDDATITAQKEAEVTTLHNVEINRYKALTAALEAECQKGLVAHGLLPRTTRETTPQPNCSLLAQ